MILYIVLVGMWVNVVTTVLNLFRALQTQMVEYNEPLRLIMQIQSTFGVSGLVY